MYLDPMINESRTKITKTPLPRTEEGLREISQAITQESNLDKFSKVLQEQREKTENLFIQIVPPFLQLTWPFIGKINKTLASKYQLDTLAP